VSGITADNKVYDQNTTATVQTASANLSGIVAGDNLSINSVTGVFDNKNVGTGKTVTLTSTYTGSDINNYSITDQATATANITAKALTATGFTAANKVYDNNTNATVSSSAATSSDIISGDNVTVSANSAGTFADKNVNNGINVSVSGVTLGGADAGNYSLTSTNAATTADITKRSLSLFVSAASREYDGTNAITLLGTGAATLQGVLGTDVVDLNLGSVTGFVDKNVGTNKAVAYSGFSISGAQSGNYQLSATADSTAEITARALTVTYTGQDKVYDGTVTANAGTSDNRVAGDLLNIDFSAAFSDKNVGSNKQVNITGVSLGNIDANNYTVSTTGSTTANITAKTLTLSGTKTYDGNASFTGSSLTLGGFVGSETVDYSNATASDSNVATANKYINAITLVDGSNGGLASNYQAPSAAYSAGVNSVVIDPKALTMLATKTYDGSDVVTNFVTLTGLLQNENLLVSNATLNNFHVATAGKYINSITLTNDTGLVSNYILPGNTALVSGVAGTFSNNTDNTATINAQTLTPSLVNAGVTKVYDATTDAPSGFTPNWNVGGLVGGDNATFASTNTAYNDANVANANKVTVSGLSIASVTGTGQVSDYVLDAVTKDVAATITARPVQVSLSSGITKVYDGNQSAAGATLGVSAVSGDANSGAVNGDSLTAVATGGTFDTVGAGLNKAYTLTGVQLSGTNVGNYMLSGGASFSDTNGVIYQRPLEVTFTGVNKVYDGNTNATVGLTYANASYAPVGVDDVAVLRTATFANKNVNTGITVNLSNVSLSGTAAGNYMLSYDPANPLHSPLVGSNAGYNATTTANITRLDSVTWVGGASGNWFDPANWAGGAVPDLANVANVIIPSGTTVDFSSTVVAPAQSGPVQIDSLREAGGGLNMSAGQLDVGSGGVTLGSINQTGGALSSVGPVVLDTFNQTAGTLAAADNFTVNQDYAQTGTGSVNVGGNTTITDLNGGVTLGNLTTLGTLSVTSTGGNISQAPGTVLDALAASIFNAGNNDVILGNTGNNFVGPVSVIAKNATLQDDTGGIVLDNVTTTGALVVNSTGGDITQTAGSSVHSNGSTSLNAGNNDVILANANNDFVGPVGIVANDATLTDGTGGIILGDIATTGVLTINSTGGDISQGPGTSVQSTGSTNLNAGTNDIILGNPNNNFVGPVGIVANDATLTDGTGGIILGDTATTGVLTINSTGGDISQGPGTSVQSTGSTNLNAGTNDILLGNPNNNFVGPVGIVANDATLTDGTGGIVLGDVTTTGVLTINSTGGDISQGPGTSVQSTGSTNLNAGTNDIILGNPNNNFVGPVGIVANDATLTDGTGGIILGDTATTGVLTINSTGGDISQGPGTSVQSTGSTNLNAGTNDILLGNPNNNFVGPVGIVANDATLTDGTGGIILGDTATTGVLTINSTGGDISQGPGTSVQSTGSTNLNAGTNDILLGNPNNNFVGPVGIVANDATLTDGTGGIILGDTATTGVLTINSTGGDISQAAGTSVQSAGITTLNAGSNDIQLANDAYNFGGSVNLTANNARLHDNAGGIVLGNVNTNGFLSVNSSGGDITQSSDGIINANGLVNLDANNSDIILTNDNDFNSDVSARGGFISLTDANNGLILGEIASSKGLTVVSKGGDITQKPDTKIVDLGTTSLSAKNGGQRANIILQNENNDFTKLNASGDVVSITDMNGLIQGVIDANEFHLNTGGDNNEAIRSGILVTQPTVGANAAVNAKDESLITVGTGSETVTKQQEHDVIFYVK
jgi:hypothetical protein